MVIPRCPCGEDDGRTLGKWASTYSPNLYPTSDLMAIDSATLWGQVKGHLLFEPKTRYTNCCAYFFIQWLWLNTRDWFFSEWSYFHLSFTLIQQVSSLGVLISFVTLVLTSTTWHHLELAQAGKLTFGREVVIMPFFLPSIFMKAWITSTTMSCTKFLCDKHGVSATLSSVLVLAPAIALLLYQWILHLCLGFKMKEQSVITSIVGNISSNVRPITKTKKRHNAQVRAYFLVESLSSTVVYSLLAIFCVLTTQSWEAIVGCGFIPIHIILTQLYLWTQGGRGLLFDDSGNQEESFQLTEQPTRKKDKNIGEEGSELRILKWIFLTVSLIATMALFGFMGWKIFQGKTSGIICRE